MPSPIGTASRTGFVQIIPEYQNQVLIHRLWTLEPRRGNGSAILNDLCEMADRHRIVLKLKALPLGAKPYPFSRDQLVDWYQRHGFEGRRRRMVRMPRVSCITNVSSFKVLQVTP